MAAPQPGPARRSPHAEMVAVVERMLPGDRSFRTADLATAVVRHLEAQDPDLLDAWTRTLTLSRVVELIHEVREVRRRHARQQLRVAVDADQDVRRAAAQLALAQWRASGQQGPPPVVPPLPPFEVWRVTVCVSNGMMRPVGLLTHDDHVYLSNRYASQSSRKSAKSRAHARLAVLVPVGQLTQDVLQPLEYTRIFQEEEEHE